MVRRYMDNILEKPCCGRSLFTASQTPGVANLNCLDRGLSQDNEVSVPAIENPVLYSPSDSSSKNFIDNLEYRVSREPQDLRSHILRITHYMRLRHEAGVYGALVDLFIVLGQNGVSIRQRMLGQAKSFLSHKRFLFFNSIIQRGIRDSDPVPDVQTAVLSKGYTGKKVFIIENAHRSCKDLSDPRQEAIDCLIHGKVNEARKILEHAVLQEPWREDLQIDLLEIYWATRDLSACQSMYARLADEFIPDHHAWVEVVERISDALGGV